MTENNLSETEIFSLQAEGGEYRANFAERVAGNCSLTGKAIRAKFQGCAIIVKPGDLPQDIDRRLEEEFSRQCEEYRNSPEGKAQAAEREARLASKAATLLQLVDDLDSVLQQGRDATIDWLVSYSNLASRQNNRFPEVIEKLKAAGYSEADAKYDTTVTADIMARYIVANSILCMQGNMPPNPNLVERFSEEYRDLVQAESSTPNVPKPRLDLN